MIDFSQFALGRKPPTPAKPRLALGDYVKVKELPAVPASFPAPTIPYPMDLNDRYGDCVVAALDHALQVIDVVAGVGRKNWTNDEIIAYYKTQNPAFPDQDEGMVVQTFLEYLTKQGVILGFAEFDPSSETDVKAATYIFHAPVIGVDLRVAQQTETVWDYVAHSSDWGGHCIPWVGFSGTPDRMTCVTWGELVEMTEAFVQHQVDESWIVITQDFVNNPVPGFDLAAFAADYKEITGRDFPVVVPTPPPPPPPPPVPPDPVPPEPKPSFWEWLVALWHKLFG